MRPKTLETTVLGAAYLAGLAVGYWDSVDDIQSQWTVDKVFEPAGDAAKVEDMLKYWHKAVKCAQNWIEE